MQTELLKRSGARPIALIKMAFSDGDLHVWTPGTGSVSWASATWTGLYPVLQVSGIGETSSSTPGQVEIAFSPFVRDKQTDALSDLLARMKLITVRGTEVDVWQAFLTDAGAVVADPLLRYVGRISQRVIKQAEAGWSLSFVCSNEFESGDRATMYAQTTGRMAAMGFPTDKAFETNPEPMKAQWPGPGYWSSQKG